MNIPSTPQKAHNAIVALAKKKRITVCVLLNRIGMTNNRATVSRWKTNKNTYDISLFCKIIEKAKKIKA